MVNTSAVFVSMAITERGVSLALPGFSVNQKF